MLEGAFEHVRDGLEAPVGMVGRADGLPGCVVRRAHVVEEQERVDHVEAGAGERAPDHEPAALDGPGGGDDLGDGAMLWHTGVKAGRAPAIPPGRAPVPRRRGQAAGAMAFTAVASESSHGQFQRKCLLTSSISLYIHQ